MASGRQERSNSFKRRGTIFAMKLRHSYSDVSDESDELKEPEEAKEKEKAEEKRILQESEESRKKLEELPKVDIRRKSELICGRKSVQYTDIMSSDKIAALQDDKRTSQWEELMRKFSEAHKEECKTVSLDIPRAPRSAKLFPTGSQYEGMWDVLGMSGFGTYTFPSGVVYTGEFEDGMFQGVGELTYPCGTILRGTWKKGHMIERTLIFAEGLEYSEEDWMYCRMPDRRFTIEYENGMQPGGKSYITAEQPTRDIPDGFYDTGDGFYDPRTKIVYNADDITDIIRSPSEREQKWIVDNCRTSPDDPVGPRQELYEEWSEPQVNPAPPPRPAAASRAPRRSASFDEDKDFEDDDFYEQMRKSRSSYLMPRSRSSYMSLGRESTHRASVVGAKKKSQRFRWQE